MSRLGRLDEYDPKVQNFESYVERFEHYVRANEIAEAKKLSVFLTVIGAEAYEILKNLVVPLLPGDKTFAEVKELLQSHYNPKTSVIAERCKFNRRVQLDHESVEDFVVELKHLARKCNFGPFLLDALRDRLVAGIRSEETQKALFTADALTFERACKIALDSELAAKQTAAIQAGSRAESINAVKMKTNEHQRSDRDQAKGKSSARDKTKKQKCYHCGKTHAPEQCWYQNYSCRLCSKVGYLQNMCRTSKSELKAHAVLESSDEEEHTLYNCTVYTSVKNGYVVTVNVEGQKVPMQVDTGAAVTVVPENLSQLNHCSYFPTQGAWLSRNNRQIPIPSSSLQDS
ncbi:uncharacterized protein [Dermacentor andersoni]|uniref:uncharacterized protein n=1 Tax=Dermacentor andersoni TaxID=34620 RepID=UPI002155A632|nr:uncharacterized protein LOC126535655 [Dermacentor andersoni]